MFFDVERKTRFHVKRRAVIPEALGAYFGSAGRLFRKGVEVWMGLRGGLGGNVGWFWGKCGALGWFWSGFGGLMMFIFLYKYAAKGVFMLILGQKCEFWVLARIRENTYLCGGDIIFCVQTTTKTIQL